MYLCLDLSLKCSGWAKFTKNGRLVKKGRISPDPKLDNCSKIHFIAVKIRGLLTGVDEVIIEDLFYSKNFPMVKWLARLSGAVITEWVDNKYKVPIFYTASRARSLAGINGRAQKAEIQVFILEKYKFTTKTKIKKYQTKIGELKKLLDNKEIKRSVFKYRMGKLSNVIFEETGYDENQVDAILLGLAFSREKNR